MSQLWIPTGERSGLLDAHRDGKRFVVRADEKLTAFSQMETEIKTHPPEIERPALERTAQGALNDHTHAY